MCEKCDEDAKMIGEIYTCVRNLVALSLACRDVNWQRGDLAARKQELRDLMGHWIGEIRQDGPQVPQQIALRLTQKFAAWANKELAGVTLDSVCN